MDFSIRQWLITAQQTENCAIIVEKIYNILKSNNESLVKKDKAVSFGSDLYVQTAELALKISKKDIALNLLSMYFSGDNPPNQFECRAYLCYAQAVLPNATKSINKMMASIVYLMKALDICEQNARYSFLVYNTSVIYWTLIRPFYKSKHQSKLCPSLFRVVQCLDNTNDCDYDWRATLKIGLLESYAYVGDTENATISAKDAYLFCMKNCKQRIIEVIKTQLKYNLAQCDAITSDLPREFSAFVLLKQLKNHMHKSKNQYAIQRNKEEHEHGEIVCKLLDIVNFLSDEVSKKNDSSFLSLPQKTNVRFGNFEFSRNEEVLNEQNKIITKIEKKSIFAEEKLMSRLKSSVLYEIARVCTEENVLHLASTCVKALKKCDTKDQVTAVQIEFLECELALKESGCNKYQFTKNNVNTRVNILNHMISVLSSSKSMKNGNLVQSGCASVWNVCLPLLQKDLRHHTTRALLLIIEYLEEISSMNFEFCCQVHTEIALTYENLDKYEAAIKHINQAIQYDFSGKYKERLSMILQRLTLSSQLYQTPKNPLDVAAVIIEQAKKSEEGSLTMKRSLLAKVGSHLAPDAFQYVLDAEDFSKVPQRSKDSLTRLYNIAIHYENSLKKLDGHLERFGNKNDRKRFLLWVELVKTARRQKVWDVCRSACLFAMLYDDGRWNINKLVETSTDESNQTSSENEAAEVSKDVFKSLNIINVDSMRMFAEVSFIAGEAYVQMVQNHGILFNEKPTNPMKNFQLKKNYSAIETQNQHWNYYCEFIRKSNERATNFFLRGVDIGVQIKQSWMVCSGAAYLWNYNCHLLYEHRYAKLVPTLKYLLKAFKKTGHLNNAELVVCICNVIGRGLMLPWIPDKQAVLQQQAQALEVKKKRVSRNKNPVSSHLNVASEAHEDLRYAQKAVEYGLQLTDGHNLDDVIPIKTRYMIIVTWLQIKQMMNEKVEAPNFGCKNEKLVDQHSMRKIITLVEMLNLNENGMVKFTVPTIEEIFDMLLKARWSDILFQIELMNQLCMHSFSQKNLQLVTKIAFLTKKVENIALKQINMSKNNRAVKYQLTVLHEALSNIYKINGQSLMLGAILNKDNRTVALESFFDSVRHGKEAHNYEQVITSSKLWYKAACGIVSISTDENVVSLESLKLDKSFSMGTIETSFLRTSLKHMLGFLSNVENWRNKNKTKQQSKGSSKISIDSHESGSDESNKELTILSVSLYSLLFNTYAIKVNDQWL